MRWNFDDQEMIEPNNPEIDVDELMSRVRSEVARRRLGSTSHPAADALDAAAIEAHVSSAARVAAVRTALPSRLRFFPFTAPIVQRTLLKVFAFLFRDQRNVNAELIAALAHSVALDRQLRLRFDELEARLRRMESRD
jgi:hypothetical protein